VRRSKAMENLVGQMADAIEDSGKMANKMVEAHIAINKEFKDVECGQMERSLNGLTEHILIYSSYFVLFIY
jgi:hypothetical protein